MRKVLVAVVAIIAMGLAVRDAVASTGMSITNGVWSYESVGPMTFSVGGLGVICDVTLEVDINSSIAKSPGASFGSIKPDPWSQIVNCNQGVTATVLFSVPLDYQSFTGTLPAISAIRLSGLYPAILLYLPVLGASCLYDSGSLNMSISRNFGGALQGFTLTGSGLAVASACPLTLSFRGTFTPLAPWPIGLLI